MYLFTDEQLRTAAGGCEPKDLVRALRSRHLLVTHEGNRLKIKQKIASMGDQWTRFYAIRSKIVEVNMEVGEEENSSVPTMPAVSAASPSSAEREIEEFEPV